MLTYEPVDDRHYQFLYDLLKERPKNASISHKKMPNFHEHVTFVDSFPYAEWFVIRKRGEMAGSVYLTHQKEFGMFVKKEFSGQGIATTAFKWMMRRHPGERLLSNVNPKNAKIKRILRGLGFRIVQETMAYEA